MLFRSVQRLIGAARAAALRGEHKHRTMGRLLTGRATRYRASAPLCADAMVARWYAIGLEVAPRAAADIVGMREDALYASLAAEHKYKIPMSSAAHAEIVAWDYCDEVVY